VIRGERSPAQKSETDARGEEEEEEKRECTDRLREGHGKGRGGGTRKKGKMGVFVAATFSLGAISRMDCGRL